LPYSNNIASKNIFDTLVLLLFLFGIQFFSIPVNSQRLIILFVVAFILINYSTEFHFYYNKKILVTLLIFSFFVAYVCVAYLVTAAKEMTVVKNSLILLFQTGIGSYIFVYYLKPNIDHKRFVHLVYFICVMHGFVITINFLSPEFRNLWDIIIPPSLGNIDETNVQSYFRMRGITQQTGAKVSSFLAIGVLLFVHILLGNEPKKFKLTSVVLFPFIIIGILFTGRTGLLMLPISVFFLIVSLIYHNKLKIYHLILLMSLPFFGLLSYLLIKEIYFFFTNGGIILPNGEELFSRWERWAFGNFDSFFTGKTDGLHDVEVIKTHYFLPSNTNILLFGNQEYWSLQRIRSDVGYIRSVYSVGLIGSLFFYLSYIYMMISSKLKNEILSIFILFWILIIELKESMINLPFFSSFIFSYFLIAQKENEKVYSLHR
jgi:hypothetical protein